MSVEDFKDHLLTQNLADKEFSKEDVEKQVRLCYKTGRRDTPTCNWVIEVSPQIRSVLLDEGRFYLDFAACKVVDHLVVTRCYKCQRYGHVEKHCKRAGGPLCSHCGREGHLRSACSRSDDKPVCINCLAAKRPCEHRVGSTDCPMYRRLLENHLSLVDYGQH